MTQNQISIQFLVHRLRYRYRNNIFMNELLDRILWYSIPVVYPDFDKDMCSIEKSIERRKSTKKRTNRYLRDMFVSYDKIYFLTLTFRDDVFISTSERTRHRYVSWFLDEHCRDYFANLDYGLKNDREHYHAVVALNAPKIDLKDWKYGIANIKPVLCSKSAQYGYKDRLRISTYLNKLTNHAGKVGTGKPFHKRGLKDVDDLPF